MKKVDIKKGCLVIKDIDIWDKFEGRFVPLFKEQKIPFSYVDLATIIGNLNLDNYKYHSLDEGSWNSIIEAVYREIIKILQESTIDEDVKRDFLKFSDAVELDKKKLRLSGRINYLNNWLKRKYGIKMVDDNYRLNFFSAVCKTHLGKKLTFYTPEEYETVKKELIAEREKVKEKEEILPFTPEDQKTLDASYLQLKNESDPIKFENTIQAIVLENEKIGRELLRRLNRIVPFGFEPIDVAIDGGLVKKTSTLLIAEEMKKKNEILISFALQGLRDKDLVVYATSKRPSEEILDLIALEDLTRLRIIDLHRDIHTQNPVGGLIEEGNVVFISANLTLFQHSIVNVIKKYPREAHKRVILDVYEDLLKYYGWEQLFEILKNQLWGLHFWNCTTVVSLDTLWLSHTGLREVKTYFDNVVRLSRKGMQVFIEKLYGGLPGKGQHKAVLF